MKINYVNAGDCLESAKELPNNSIDLIVTSPPYANTLSYGKRIPCFKPENYVDWFMPLAKEAGRFLKDSGSFILNINDRVVNKKRSLYVFELVCRIAKETDLDLHDRYIWHKPSGLPTSGTGRLDDKMEYFFHFVKSDKAKEDKSVRMKNNMDEIRVPYADITLLRLKTAVGTNDAVDENGIVREQYKKVDPNPKGKIPTTVFRFNTCGVLRNKASKKHPAAFHPDIPSWFIRWLTNEGDVVLDPFMGSGTTAYAATKLKRNWIGFEMNQSYLQLIDLRVKEAKTEMNSESEQQ